MNKTIRVLYISLSGNTTHFVKKLTEYLNLWHDVTVNATDVYTLVKDKEAFKDETVPFVAILPTYLEGGNGHETGTTEILTTPLREYLRFNDNYKQCKGIVGSGNKNFNDQFCLTAKQYSEEFGFPVIDNFELRGTDQDVIRIADKMMQILNE